MSKLHVCKVCDRSFEKAKGDTRRIIGTLICPSCSQWHYYCASCKRALLRSDFSPVTSTDTSRLQYNCKSCVRRRRTYLNECSYCNSQEIRIGGYRNQNSSTLCATCVEVVKLCRKCDRHLPIEQFSLSRGKKRGRIAHCKDCCKSRHASLDERKRTEKKLRRLGLTWGEYQAMIRRQKNKCAICKRPEQQRYASRQTIMYGPKPLSVDHCHATGSVRALLCSACNLGLGRMQDSPERLRAAAEYIKHARSRRADGAA